MQAIRTGLVWYINKELPSVKLVLWQLGMFISDNSQLEMTKCASIQVLIPQVPSMAPMPTPKISALDASFLVGQRLITKQISV